MSKRSITMATKAPAGAVCFVLGRGEPLRGLEREAVQSEVTWLGGRGLPGGRPVGDC